MDDTQRGRGSTPVLSLLALAGALFGVISLAQADPAGSVELRINMTQSTGRAGATPIVAP
ncbi:hypothetical protein GCM10022226_48210 [Sphaerisporangium flaviroseum]|uniref:Uncharacterized protein n=1 Tax=Sphaerisporangium flaviroseum TaxID=509199 RepID=A0ABP7IMQ3_9ACTN